MSKVKIEPHVADVLKRSVVDGATLTLPGQLDRKSYTEVNKIIELLGGKWNRKAGCHIFPKAFKAIFEEALDAESVVDKKKEFQLFETPADLADEMVRLASLEPKMRILEPSAGNGRLIEAIHRQMGVQCPINAIEIQPELADGLRHKYEGRGSGVVVTELDFLDITAVDRPYDRVIMNPPFTKGQDIAHIKKAMELLKHEGVLVALTAPGWQFNSQRKFKEFRDWLESKDPRDVSYREVPAGTFKQEGTDIKTLLLRIVK
jgi:predicted RNA methylase